MNSSGGSRAFPTLSLLAALVFFTGLWLLDFPKPMVDDLFYTGAALNLADGGDFSNPLIARQEFPSHFFFVHLPLPSYALTGWLKIFGVNAAALTGFQMTMFAIIAAATIALLRRHGAPKPLEWFVPLGIVIAFFPAGLRPEALAVALGTAGFALVECGWQRGPKLFAAFLLLAFGGMTAPRLTVFIAAFAALAVYRLWRNSTASGWKRWAFCGPGFAAGIMAGLLFLWMIDFRLAEFLRTFHFHATGVLTRIGGSKWNLFYAFLKMQTESQYPLLALPLILIWPALRRPLDDFTRMSLALAAAFIIEFLIGGLRFGAAWFSILMSLFLLASLCRRMPRIGILFSYALLFSCMLLAAGSWLASTAACLSGRIKRDRGEQAAVAFALRPTPEHPLLVDASAARYIFDYRLPRGSFDWAFSSRFPDRLPTEAALRPGDIYLIGPASLEILRRDTFINEPAPETVRVGLRRWAYPKYPRRIYIIRAEDCNGLRSAPVAP